MMTAERVCRHSFVLDDNGNIVGEGGPHSEEEAGRELDRAARKYAALHRVSYREALEQIMADPDNETLLKAYNAAGSGRDDDTPHGDDPSVKIDKLARAYMEKAGEKSYVAAVHAVLHEDARLRREYGNFCGGRN